MQTPQLKARRASEFAFQGISTRIREQSKQAALWLNIDQSEAIAHALDVNRLAAYGWLHTSEHKRAVEVLFTTGHWDRAALNADLS